MAIKKTRTKIDVFDENNKVKDNDLDIQEEILEKVETIEKEMIKINNRSKIRIAIEAIAIVLGLILTTLMSVHEYHRWQDRKPITETQQVETKKTNKSKVKQEETEEKEDNESQESTKKEDSTEDKDSKQSKESK